MYRQSLDGKSPTETAKDALAVEADSAKQIAQDTEAAAANAGLKK